MPRDADGEPVWFRTARITLVFAGGLGVAGMVRWSDLVEAGFGLWFGLSLFVAGIAYLALLGGTEFRLAREKAGGIGLKEILLGAAVLRVVLWFCTPADDVGRYVWEGRIQAAGWNPYLFSPDAAGLAGLRDSGWTLINHKDWPAIYPPGVELLFRYLAIGGPIGFKALAALADLGIVCLLARNRTNADDRWRCAFYAWNPLFAYCSWGAGHFDVVMVLPLLFAGRLLQSAKSLATAAISCAFLGFSIAVKLVPILLVPIWFVALNRKRIWFLLAFALPLLLAFVYGYPNVNVWGSAYKFAQITRTNDLIWWLFPPSIHPNERVGILLFLVAVGTALGLRFLPSRSDPQSAIEKVLLSVVLLTPALHPWYLVWAAPFVRGRKIGYSYATLTVTIAAYFSLTSSSALGPAWVQPWWHHLFIVGPPLLVFGLLSAFKLRNRVGIAAEPARPAVTG